MYPTSRSIISLSFLKLLPSYIFFGLINIRVPLFLNSTIASKYSSVLYLMKKSDALNTSCMFSFLGLPKNLVMKQKTSTIESSTTGMIEQVLVNFSLYT